MFRHVRRMAAVSALTPMAVVVAGGSATAAVDMNPSTLKLYSTVSTTCFHPDFGPALGFRAKLDLEGNGTFARGDHDDVDSIRVVATDNQGYSEWNDDEVHVTKIAVWYFDDENDEILHRSASGHSTSYGGRRTFFADRDDVHEIRVKVWWSDAFGDEETLSCRFTLPRYNQLEALPN